MKRVIKFTSIAHFHFKFDSFVYESLEEKFVKFIKMKIFCVFFLLLESVIMSPLSNNQCPKYCECDSKNNEQFVSCINGESSVTIQISDAKYDSGEIFVSDAEGKKLTVNCTTFDELAYEVLPQLNVSNLIGLDYNNCPLPTNGSLSVGFNDLYGILFRTERKTDLGTFEKRHVNGLRSLNELRLLSKATTFNLADDAFTGLSQLRKLYLHSNRINFEALKSLTSAIKIEIGFLEDGFNLDGLQGLEKLEQINLADLHVKRLSKRMFENLPSSVDTIFFYDNTIDTIDPDVFAANNKLFFVRFFDNVVQHFPSHLEINSDRFLYFQLMGNHESIPDELLSNLPTLRDVDIHCNLKSVPENLFKGSYNLNIVNLTGNQLTDLPENLLANQTSLFHLYLDRNRFVDALPKDLIKNLMTKPKWVSSVLFPLSFASNQIRTISEDDWQLLLRKNGEYNFSNNLIADFSVFNNFGDEFVMSGSFFIFNGNPIDCDCAKVNALRKYLKNEAGIWRFSYEKNDATCATPANLKGKLVADVQCDE